MRWVLQNIPLLVALFIVFSIVRAVRRAQKLSADHKTGRNESDEQRRVREIQERIRRIATERRSGRGAEAPPAMPRKVEPSPRPSVLRPQRVPPLDPFGGPTTRPVPTFERKVEPPALPPPLHTHTKSAELERQVHLANELRALEEARVLAQRRAAKVVTAGKEEAASEGGMLGATRTRLQEDLRDPQSLRRAWVLREVLGPPVALR